jgi:hypothetical protein
MAAANAMERVYWGPLIGQREGLIDDGTDFFPEIFHVTFYGRANGTVDDYRARPAFEAFRTVNRLLPGRTFLRRIRTTGPLEILEFHSPDDTLHAVWCHNGACATSADCYPATTLDAARAYDRSGHLLERVPDLFTQSPVYLVWADDAAIHLQERVGAMTDVRLATGTDGDCTRVWSDEWRGLIRRNPGDPEMREEALLPERLTPMNSPESRVMRDKRNRVWSVPPIRPGGPAIVVKHFRPARGVRGWLQSFKPTKALRSWNGAQELLRRGIPTPRPVARLEHRFSPREGENYYLCETFEGGSSARQAFHAINRGEPEFLGMPTDELISAITAVVEKTHRRGVFFRDLSPGNLLLRRSAEGGIECALIDTARARAGVKSISLRRRLADLMRLCHPLGRDGRDELLAAYFGVARLRFRRWMRLAFHYYDWKHRIKGKVRRRKRASLTSCVP